MVYLIIDTNTWLYLANGFDTISGKIDNHSGKHINVFDQIKEKSYSGEFTVLVNDIILFEWEKNKKSAQLHINQLVTLKKFEIAEIVKIKSTLSLSDFKLKCAEINNQFDDKIMNAQRHIENVDGFLKTCPKYEVSDELKLEITEMAISKEKAPFLNSKNNVADAAILFGGIDFLKSNQKEHLEKAVFASANYKDFGVSKTSNAFHPDIKSRLDGIHLEYHQNWIDLIGLTEDLQYEIDIFHEYIRENYQYFTCLSPQCEHDDYQGYGYLDNKYCYSKSKSFIDPNQLELFEMVLPVHKELIRHYSIGQCVRCCQNHILCPDCESLLIDINDVNQFYCDNCNQCLEMEKCSKTGEFIVYTIDQENIHL